MRFALDKETENTETRKKENDAWNTELTLFFPPRFSAPTKPHQNLLLAGKVCVLFSGFACCVFFSDEFLFSGLCKRRVIPVFSAVCVLVAGLLVCPASLFVCSVFCVVAFGLHESLLRRRSRSANRHGSRALSIGLRESLLTSTIAFGTWARE